MARVIFTLGLLCYISIQNVQASCPPGWFGDSCLYSCNCGTSCDQETGVCPGVCDPGWVKGGQLCQKRNIAYGKMASTPVVISYPHWPASNAVDGNNDINGGSSTCFHGEPGLNELNIDLGRRYVLNYIKVYLRANFKRRIASSYIYLDRDLNRVCYTFPATALEIVNPFEVRCSSVARYVTIRNPGTGRQDNTPLNICEVEIYDCSQGTYGINCTKFCYCSRCNMNTGTCIGDCRPGWQGERCDTACNSSSYGVNCAKRCEDRHCAPGSSCDRYTGLCETGCQPGWKADDCTEKCASFHYGQNCTMQCALRNCFGSHECDHVTGSCDHGCMKGWMGLDCRQECLSDSYGYNCNNTCADRKCVDNSVSCNRFSGSCDTLCKAGWEGNDCTKTCDKFHYGVNCSRLCTKRNCLASSPCFHETGMCEPGCQSGWEGIDCTTACDDEHYGRDCEGVCSSRQCVGVSDCNITSGECLEGCIQGWGGLDCAQKLEIPGNPAAVVGGVVGGLVVFLGVIVVVVVVLVRKGLLKRGKPEHTKLEGDTANVYVNIAMEKEPDFNRDRKANPVIVKDIQKEDGSDTESIDSICTRDDDYDDSCSNAVNYYNLDDFGTNHVISVSNLEAKTMELEENKQMLEEEYKSLPEGFMHPYDESQRPKNKSKNRYKGYYPYNYNRVVLRVDNGDSAAGDYINASYIDGYKSEKKYIAAQGPYKPNIVVDFWRMLWQEKCEIVVMVTGLVESGKVKCLRYWPVEGSESFGDVTVTTNVTNILADYTVTKLTVQHKKDSGKRQLVHFHFTSWPDHGVPDTTALLTFLWRVQSISEHQHHPITVHCSAGIGRTGTYIAVESLIQQAATEGVVDVVSFVTAMRGQRRNMIQTKEQYHFTYRAIATAVLQGNTTLDSDFIDDMDARLVSEVTMGNRSTQQHIEAIWRTSQEPNTTDTVVTVASYRKRLGFFVMTAKPNKDTVWNQIDNNGSRSLVTWSGNDENILPGESKPLITGKLTLVVLKSKKISEGTVLQEIQLKNKENNDATTVYHFQLTGSVRDLDVHELTRIFLQWSGQPECGSCTIISRSVSETRLLILLLNLASRLEDDGKVDVISDMRRLQSQLGGPRFTVNDVRLCVEFAQRHHESKGVYANL